MILDVFTRICEKKERDTEININKVWKQCIILLV